MLNIGLLFKPELIDMKPIIDLLLVVKKYNEVDYHILGAGETFCPKELLCYFPSQTEKVDLILCFGGDGTILRSVDYSVKNNAPVLGINYGKLGFLSEYTLNDLKKAINNLLQKNYKLESRMLLDIKVYRNKSLIINKLALNDAVLYKGSDAKLVDLRLMSNKHFIYDTRSDGLIISSPTGSTAYSLSAGGAIISPNMKAFIVTPLNPHNLTIRPMVLSSDDSISVSLSSESQVFLQVDGVTCGKLETSDKIIIKKHIKSMNFIKLNHKSFYKILRHKLHMGKQ